MTETEAAFFAVIRAFLTKEETAPAELAGLTEKQWNHLFVLAAQHSLLAAVYDVVGKTPEFRQISEEFREHVRIQAMQCVGQQASRTALFLADERAMETIGVQPLVLKGIVCRSLYPKPDLRLSGDEDLLIREKDFATVDAYFMQKGFVRDKEIHTIPEETGYVHLKTGAFYEIHTSLFSRESSAYGCLNDAFSNVFEYPSQIEVQGQTIFTLEETHHLFYLLCHSFKHFLHGGIGIRQVCDMVQMIRAYGNKMDWETFWKLCEQYHMTCFCVNLLDIGERYLGFSYEESGAVRCTRKIRPDSEALLHDILDAGAFGKSSAGRIHSANITLYAAETGSEEHAVGGVRKSLFPETSYIKDRYPYAARYPFLLPVAYAERIFQWMRQQRAEKEQKSSIEVGMERAALLKKYDMIRTADERKRGGTHAERT